MQLVVNGKTRIRFFFCLFFLSPNSKLVLLLIAPVDNIYLTFLHVNLPFQGIYLESSIFNFFRENARITILLVSLQY